MVPVKEGALRVVYLDCEKILCLERRSAYVNRETIIPLAHMNESNEKMFLMARCFRDTWV